MMTKLFRSLLFAFAPLLAGCSTLDLDIANFGRQPADQTAQVTEVVCLWEAAEGVGLDGLPSRGFAGQMLFFTHGQAEPVRVNGDVRIYVFDDHGTLEEQARPLHEFNFPAEVWNTYLRTTNLGPAYQMFIPYTRKGGRLADCALRVRMTGDNRLPLYSKLANVTLPGRRMVEESAIAAAISPTKPTPEIAPQPSIAQLAAIQQASAELGGGARTAQLQRLKSAARSAVRHADYDQEEDAAAYDGESGPSTLSRRYRMSSGANPE